MKLLASTPGKAFLLGEYAVLAGAPAVLAALNRRVRVTLDSAARWSVSARLGGATTAAEFRIAADGQVTWGSAADDAARRALAAVPAVFGEFAPRAPHAAKEHPPAAIGIDSRDLYRDGAKLGLGSSAAVTVALAGALTGWFGAARPTLDRLVAAHRRFQGGRGSGADVAAALHGGVIRLQSAQAQEPPRIVPAALPEGIALAWLWTGVAADTRRHLDRLEDWRRRRPEAATAAMERLVAAAESPWSDAGSLMAAVTAFAAELERFDSEGRLGIYAGGHGALRAMAITAGVTYKPCGAGGGDMGVALSPDPGALDDFVRRAAGAGASRVPLAVDDTGLSITAPPPGPGLGSS